MATYHTLRDRGDLVEIEIMLGPREMPSRQVFAVESMTRWLDDDLPTEPSDRGGAMSPMEQVDDLLYRFVVGEHLMLDKEYHELEPHGNGIWTLKTIDVRLFGWFVIRDSFIVVAGAMKKTLRKNSLYAPYYKSVIETRNALDLDPPKFVASKGWSDVLSPGNHR